MFFLEYLAFTLLAYVKHMPVILYDYTYSMLAEFTVNGEYEWKILEWAVKPQTNKHF